MERRFLSIAATGLAAAAASVMGDGSYLPHRPGEGAHRAEVRLRARRDEMAALHGSRPDAYTRQQDRRASRKGEKRLAGVTERRERAEALAAFRAARGPMPPVKKSAHKELRGLGWEGHLHSHARKMLALKRVNDASKAKRAKAREKAA